jgi:hypothetical protein
MEGWDRFRMTLEDLESLSGLCRNSIIKAKRELQTRKIIKIEIDRTKDGEPQRITFTPILSSLQPSSKRKMANVTSYSRGFWKGSKVGRKGFKSGDWQGFKSGHRNDLQEELISNVHDGGPSQTRVIDKGFSILSKNRGKPRNQDSATNVSVVQTFH